MTCNKDRTLLSKITGTLDDTNIPEFDCFMCQGGQVWNPVKRIGNTDDFGECECRPGMQWNEWENQCECSEGFRFDDITRQCYDEECGCRPEQVCYNEECVDCCISNMWLTNTTANDNGYGGEVILHLEINCEDYIAGTIYWDWPFTEEIDGEIVSRNGDENIFSEYIHGETRFDHAYEDSGTYKIRVVLRDACHEFVDEIFYRQLPVTCEGDLDWNEEVASCMCRLSRQELDPINSTCNCPEGQVEVDGECQDIDTPDLVINNGPYDFYIIPYYDQNVGGGHECNGTLWDLVLQVGIRNNDGQFIMLAEGTTRYDVRNGRGRGRSGSGLEVVSTCDVAGNGRGGQVKDGARFSPSSSTTRDHRDRYGNILHVHMATQKIDILDVEACTFRIFINNRGLTNQVHLDRETFDIAIQSRKTGRWWIRNFISASDARTFNEDITSVQHFRICGKLISRDTNIALAAGTPFFVNSTKTAARNGQVWSYINTNIVPNKDDMPCEGAYIRGTSYTDMIRGGNVGRILGRLNSVVPVITTGRTQIQIRWSSVTNTGTNRSLTGMVSAAGNENSTPSQIPGSVDYEIECGPLSAWDPTQNDGKGTWIYTYQSKQWRSDMRQFGGGDVIKNSVTDGTLQWNASTSTLQSCDKRDSFPGSTTQRRDCRILGSSLIIAGLTPNTEYMVRMRAISRTNDVMDSEWSDIIPVRTTN